jgi:hypothetical protein
VRQHFGEQDMQQKFVDSNQPTFAAEPSGRTRFRWKRRLAASLALSVAVVSTVLLVNAGGLEPSADTAVLDAVRFGSGLTT